MDTQAELDLQVGIWQRAVQLHHRYPTMEHARYLEQCETAVTRAEYLDEPTHDHSPDSGQYWGLY